eukprot:GILK01012205.1.p1 GENE.GILK01012205.1~~GILK01012205.1.p1  ORF type:complete len:1026 (-),score=315.99 GILK01012205.1:52-2988(-)
MSAYVRTVRKWGQEVNRLKQIQVARSSGLSVLSTAVRSVESRLIRESFNQICRAMQHHMLQSLSTNQHATARLLKGCVLLGIQGERQRRNNHLSSLSSCVSVWRRSVLREQLFDLLHDMQKLEVSTARAELAREAAELQTNQLHLELDQARQENVDATNNISDMKESIRVLNEEKSVLEEQRSELMQRMNLLKSEMDQLDVRKQERIDHLESSKNELQNRNEELEQIIQSQSNDIDQSNASIEKLANEKAALETQIIALESEISSLNQSTAELNKELNIWQERYRYLLAQREDITVESEVLTGFLSTNISSLEKELLKEKQERKSIQQRSAEEIQLVNEQLSDLNQELQRLSEEKRQTDETVKQLCEDINLKDKELSSVQDAVFVLENQIIDSSNRFSDALSDFQKERDALIRDLESSRLLGSTLEHEKVSLKREIEELSVLVARAYGDKEQLMQQNEQIKSRFTDELHIAQRELNGFRSQLDSMTREREQLLLLASSAGRHGEKRFDDLMQRIQDLTEEKFEQQIQLKRVESELVLKSEEVDSITNQVRALQEVFEQLRSDHAEQDEHQSSHVMQLEDERRALLNQIEQLKHELTQCEERVTSIQKLVHDLENENQHLKATLQQNETQFKEELTLLQTELASVNLDLEQTKLSMDIETKKVLAMEREKEERQAEKTDEDATVSGNDYRLLLEELTRVRKMLRHSENRVHELIHEKDNLQIELRVKQQEFADNKNLYGDEARLESEFLLLSTKLEHLENRLIDAEAMVKSSQAENFELKQELKRVSRQQTAVDSAQQSIQREAQREAANKVSDQPPPKPADLAAEIRELRKDLFGASTGGRRAQSESTQVLNHSRNSSMLSRLAQPTGVGSIGPISPNRNPAVEVYGLTPYSEGSSPSRPLTRDDLNTIQNLNQVKDSEGTGRQPSIAATAARISALFPATPLSPLAQPLYVFGQSQSSELALPRNQQDDASPRFNDS